MGRVAVLQPQDLWKNRFDHKHHRNLIPPSMKFRKNTEFSVNCDRSPSHLTLPKSNRRKKSPQKNSKTSIRDSSTSPPKMKNDNNNKLVMEQVKILKRGELLTDLAKNSVQEDEKVENSEADDLLVLSSTDRLGPEPEMVPKQMSIVDFYAGSAFIVSPPPSSLPLPAFFKKKSFDSSSSTDDATSDLIRLLRLDLD